MATPRLLVGEGERDAEILHAVVILQRDIAVARLHVGGKPLIAQSGAYEPVTPQLATDHQANGQRWIMMGERVDSSGIGLGGGVWE